MPDITMPKLSDTMTEGTVVSWKKSKGDKVEIGDVIAEIETDKATMEMEAFDEGILSEIFVEEGGKAEVGGRIAFIKGSGEEAPAGEKETGKKEKGKEAAGDASEARQESVSSDQKAHAQQQVEQEEGKPAPASASVGEQASSSAAAGSGEGRVKASPLARKIAASEGVDLAGITGSGPGGRIVEADVRAAASGKGAAKPAQPKAAAAEAPAAEQKGVAVPAPVPTVPFGETKRTQLSGMRRVIAERLLQSKTQIPHFYLNIEVNAGPLQKFRAELNEALEAEGGGVKISVNDLVVRAAIAAITRVPQVNSSFDGDAIVQHGSINLAVAVAVEDGLVTPVIRDAQSRGLRDISSAIKDLASRARSKKLKPDEYQGGTFTISNLGAYGIESFDAIINPPQSAILSVGAIVKKPVVNERDEVVAGSRMAIGMSCDHRVVDGALGAQYLAELRKLIERPALMLV